MPRPISPACKAKTSSALCDVDKNYLDRAAATHKDAATYADYREMIANEADRADAIVIATADHNHAPASIRAINAGLHCYCEKPLTHTVHEARMIAEAAKRKGVATQMGTQIHAGEQLPPRGRNRPSRRDRRRHRSPRVGRQRLGRRRSSRRRPGTAGKPELGSVARPGTRPPVRARPLSSGPVATLVGLWPRNAGRHGLPLHGPAVLGLESASSHHLRSRRARRCIRKRVRWD